MLSAAEIAIPAIARQIFQNQPSCLLRCLCRVRSQSGPGYRESGFESRSFPFFAFPGRLLPLPGLFAFCWAKPPVHFPVIVAGSNPVPHGEIPGCFYWATAPGAFRRSYRILWQRVLFDPVNPSFPRKTISGHSAGYHVRQ